MKKMMLPIVVLILISLFSYFSYQNYYYSKRILEDKIDARVIKIVKDRARYKIYYNEKESNNFKLKINEDISFGYNNFFYNETFNIDEPLFVGDSIVKAPKSLLLTVYRQEDMGRKKYKVFKGND